MSEEEGDEERRTQEVAQGRKKWCRRARADVMATTSEAGPLVGQWLAEEDNVRSDNVILWMRGTGSGGAVSRVLYCMNVGSELNSAVGWCQNSFLFPLRNVREMTHSQSMKGPVPRGCLVSAHLHLLATSSHCRLPPPCLFCQFSLCGIFFILFFVCVLILIPVYGCRLGGTEFYVETVWPSEQLSARVY